MHACAVNGAGHLVDMGSHASLTRFNTAVSKRHKGDAFPRVIEANVRNLLLLASSIMHSINCRSMRSLEIINVQIRIKALKTWTS